MKNTLFLTLFLSFFLTINLSSQSKLYLSEDWSGLGGDLTTFHHNSSATDIYSNVYVVGSTMNEVNFNHDILLQKFDRSGNLIWEQTYNGVGNGDDMGIEIYIDNSQNVFPLSKLLILSCQLPKPTTFSSLSITALASI